MPLRHIIHMREIKAGIHEGGYFPGSGLNDHPTGGGRLDIARADGGSGIDDHRWKGVFGDEAIDLFLGQKFRAFVVPDHILQ